MTPYGTEIFWLETAPDKLQPALEGPITADVAIVGGGFTGLWAAQELKLADPGLDVVVIEAWEIAHGASGRNGGFAMTLLDMSLAHLVRNYGPEAAGRAHQAVVESIEAIGAVCAEHDIDCDYTRGGLMEVATNAGQELRIELDLEAAEQIGASGIRSLTGEECRQRVASPTYLRGLYEEDCAVLNPARLARGLKRVVMEQGVRVFESTPALQARTSDAGPITVVTEAGEIRADQVLLTTNAWARHFPQFKRKVIPLYTYIVLTEPLTDAQWSEVGWEGCEGVEDKRNYVHYYRRTADGRILWGGSDGVVHRSLEIDPPKDINPQVFDRLESTFRRTFPQLDEVGFTHRWGGPVAITIPFIPYFGSLPGGRIHYGFGYNGHGVAPSHTGGRILRDLVLERDDGYRDLLFVGLQEKLFPPQPILWLGAALTRSMLLKQDRKMDEGKTAGEMDPWLLRIVNKLG